MQKLGKYLLLGLLLHILVLALIPHGVEGIPANKVIEKIFRTRRVKRQNGGGYDAQRQDLGYGEGYGYSGYEDYCFDCNHCNGCGHAPRRKVLSEFDYVPK